MNVLDIIFLLPLLFALYKGFKKGLIYMVASLAALVLGLLGAVKLWPFFAGLLNALFSIAPDHLHAIAFSVAFLSIVLLVHLIAFLAEKLLKAVALSFVNRFLGMGFGVVVAAFVISMVLWPLNELNAQRQIIKPDHIEGSLLYKPLSGFAPRVFPYLKKQDWRQFDPRRKEESPVEAGSKTI